MALRRFHSVVLAACLLSVGTLASGCSKPPPTFEEVPPAEELYADGEKIVAVAESLFDRADGADIIEARDHIVFPGVLDVHVQRPESRIEPAWGLGSHCWCCRWRYLPAESRLSSRRPAEGSVLLMVSRYGQMNRNFAKYCFCPCTCVEQLPSELL